MVCFLSVWYSCKSVKHVFFFPVLGGFVWWFTIVYLGLEGLGVLWFLFLFFYFVQVLFVCFGFSFVLLLDCCWCCSCFVFFYFLEGLRAR